MPYRKKYAARRYNTARKGARSTRSRRSGRSYRNRKYTKVSRRRTRFQSATTVSPYRKFTYNQCDFLSTLTTIAFQSTKVFRGNSLFDPDYTGTGNQPYGYDQLCSSTTFFNNYNVRSSKIIVYPSVSQTYITGWPAYFDCLVVPYRDYTLPDYDISNVRRMPHVRALRFTSNSLDNKSNRCSSYASSSSVMGPEFAKDVGATGQYDGNPSRTWYWHVLIDSTTWAPTANIVVKFDVKIVYYTKLFRRQEIAQS